MVAAWAGRVGLGFEEWIHYHPDENMKPWPSRYINVTIGGWRPLGRDNIWYDGPHSSFSLGIIHFNWSL